MKTCSKCRILSPNSDFSKKSKSNDGLLNYCKSCESTRLKKYYLKNTEKIKNKVEAYVKNNKTKLKEYRIKNKDVIKKKREDYRKSNQELIRLQRKLNYNISQRIDSRLRSNFGITLEQYNVISGKQDHKCANCRRPESSVDFRSGRVRRLAIDHDHSTGKIRELLCQRCNNMLGLAKEDPIILRNAANYIEKHLQLEIEPGKI